MARKRAPEIQAVAETDTQMDMILYLAESTEEDVHIIFRRPREEALHEPKSNEVFITFYNPREGAPTKLAENHFRFAMRRRSIYYQMIAVLHVAEHELTERNIIIHFGWPLSSWLDRISIGVMVFNIMRLPKQFPNLNFQIDYSKQIHGPLTEK
jgi:hypothetical protein